MHNNRNQLIRMRHRNPLQPTFHAGLQLRRGLGPRNLTPFLPLPCTHKSRIILSRTEPKLAPVPIAQEHLMQIRINPRLQPQMARQRSSRLMRSHHFGHINSRNWLCSQPRADAMCLPLPDLHQRRITLPIHHWKALPAHGGLRLTMPDQQNIRRTLRRPKLMLLTTHT